MADVARDAHVVGCSAWRRRNRRLRAFWRHEQQAVRMAVAAATHHSYDRSSAHACTQTDLEYVTPAPVIEYVAPAPAVTFVVPSQQLPPVYTTTTVTTDDNLDMFSLVSPQFSSTAVEPVAPRVVDSLLPLEEFAVSEYDHVHQEQIAASELPENISEIPVVQEQVIVQDAVYAVPAPVEYIAPAPAMYAAPAPVEEYISPAPAVYAASAPVVELLPVPAVVQAPTPAVEYSAPLPVVFQAPTPAVENIAPAPGVQAPTLVEENIAHAPAVLHSPTPVVEYTAPAPAVTHSPTLVVESFAPAPALSEAPAPGVELFSPAPAVLPRGDEVTLLFRKTTECRPQLGVHARMTRPLHFAFKAYCRRFGLQESQVRFSCDGLLSPDHSPDQLGLRGGRGGGRRRRLRRVRWDGVSFSLWVPAHADVPVVPLWELLAGVWGCMSSTAPRF